VCFFGIVLLFTRYMSLAVREVQFEELPELNVNFCTDFGKLTARMLEGSEMREVYCKQNLKSQTIRGIAVHPELIVNSSILRLSQPKGDIFEVDQVHFSLPSICGLSFVNYNTNNIACYNRETDPKFRGKGIASCLLKCAEAFFSEMYRDSEITPTLTANIGQLDVLTWFVKNGFVSKDCSDEQLLELIYRDRAHVILDEDQYISILWDNALKYMPADKVHLSHEKSDEDSLRFCLRKSVGDVDVDNQLLARLKELRSYFSRKCDYALAG